MSLSWKAREFQVRKDRYLGDWNRGRDQEGAGGPDDRVTRTQTRKGPGSRVKELRPASGEAWETWTGAQRGVVWSAWLRDNFGVPVADELEGGETRGGETS